MKYWSEQDITGRGRVPAKIERIYHRVLDAIAFHGGPDTKVVRIGRQDDDYSLNRFEVDIEIAPGIVLPTPYGTQDAVVEGWEFEADDVDGILAEVCEGLVTCDKHLASITEVLDDLRTRARRVIGGWQRAGLPAAFVEVQLAPYDEWRGSCVPGTRVLFEGLGDRLSREVIEAHVETPGDLEKALDEYLWQLKERNTGRIELSDLGASGTIDQLAINAIASFGDVAEGLRRFASEWRFWLPDSTALVMQNGHVTAGSGADDGAIDWSRDSVTITSLPASQEALDAAIGRPVTQLLRHPFLTPDITVAGVSTVVLDGRRFVTIMFDMPQRHFCSATGRILDERLAPSPSGTVTPFRRRG